MLLLNYMSTKANYYKPHPDPFVLKCVVEKEFEIPRTLGIINMFLTENGLATFVTVVKNEKSIRLYGD